MEAAVTEDNILIDLSKISMSVVTSTQASQLL